MTKIKNLLSMEKIVEMKDLAYSEKNLLDASKAMIDYKAEKATKELEENIDIEIRLAIQEALDDFYEVMFDIADNAVTLEKRKEEKKAKKAAKKAKYSKKEDLNKESHSIILSKELMGKFTMKQAKVNKEFKVECGSELFYIAVGEPKTARKGKVNNDSIRFAARVVKRNYSGLVSKLSVELVANKKESKTKIDKIVKELDDQFSLTRSTEKEIEKSTITRIRNVETAEHGDNIDINVVSPICNEAHMREHSTRT